MSHIRTERVSILSAEPTAIDGCPIRQRRRRLGLPRMPVARAGAAVARIKKTTSTRRRVDPQIVGVHDFGDGRQAIEFEGPSLDMMLYHDGGATIAEWVTVDGEFVSLIPVGDC